MLRIFSIIRSRTNCECKPPSLIHFSRRPWHALRSWPSIRDCNSSEQVRSCASFRMCVCAKDLLSPSYVPHPGRLGGLFRRLEGYVSLTRIFLRAFRARTVYCALLYCRIATRSSHWAVTSSILLSHRLLPRSSLVELTILTLASSVETAPKTHHASPSWLQ